MWKPARLIWEIVPFAFRTCTDFRFSFGACYGQPLPTLTFTAVGGRFISRFFGSRLCQLSYMLGLNKISLAQIEGLTASGSPAFPIINVIHPYSPVSPVQVRNALFRSRCEDPVTLLSLLAHVRRWNGYSEVSFRVQLPASSQVGAGELLCDQINQTMLNRLSQSVLKLQSKI